MDTTVHPEPTAAGQAYDFSVPAHPTPEQMRRILPEARNQALAADNDEPTVPDADPRATAVQGLRDLADFLDTHPAIPIPVVRVYTMTAATDEQLAQWVEGLDELDLRPGVIDAYRNVVRTFAGLEVSCDVMAKRLGEVYQVESVVTATKLVPLTPTELVARAARDTVDDDLEPVEAAYDAQEASR